MMQIYCHAFKLLTSFSIQHIAFDPLIKYDRILDLLIMRDCTGISTSPNTLSSALLGDSVMYSNIT